MTSLEEAMETGEANRIIENDLSKVSCTDPNDAGLCGVLFCGIILFFSLVFFNC